MKKVASKTQEPPKPMYSTDAPPLDFSFRGIKSLEQILAMKPHQGKRKPITQLDESKPLNKDEKESKFDSSDHKVDSKVQQEVIEKPVETKLQIIRTIEVSTLIASQTQQNQIKSKNEPAETVKKVQTVQLLPSSIFLSYNKLRSIRDFYKIVDNVFIDVGNLKWVDLSHNRLVTLDYNFKQLKGLKTLYLHCNYLKDFAEVQKLNHLEELKSLTIHANPLETHSHFRSIIIGLLPQLNKIDSVLVTKREAETSRYYLKQANFKKLPVIANAQVPKSESSEDEEA